MNKNKKIDKRGHNNSSVTVIWRGGGDNAAPILPLLIFFLSQKWLSASSTSDTKTQLGSNLRV